MSTVIQRQPGVIKQTNTQTRSYNNCQDQQLNKKSSISIDLSNTGLKIFPQDFQRDQACEIGELCLDDNNIVQCVVDLSLFSNMSKLSIQQNKMKKFSIKRIVTYSKTFSLKNLNLSYNNIQFLDLSTVLNLTVLNLAHNNLSTMILPQKCLQQIDISYNTFSNIQHSVLSSRVFPKLTNLNISHNNRSLYDLILAVDGKQLTPVLRCLDCSHNVLSYIQFLPTSLEYLDLEHNHFIFDRRAVNQIIRLHKLKQLKITGNTICNSFVDILKTKTKYGTNSQLKLVYQQQPCVKQSPYKLYTDHQESKKIIHGNITYSNFTLGDECDAKYDDQIDIDPEYNLIKKTPTTEIEDAAPFFSNGKQKYVEQKSQQQPPSALKSVENSLKSQKFKLKIDGVRYQNHYRLYFQKIMQFMLIPPLPILHKDRNTNISLRIDPSQDKQILNQFELFNQMFKSRGGIHYLRKIFNWQRSQKLKKQDAKVLFINIELTKEQFDKLCNGNYVILQQMCSQKHLLNQQPCSFSCYHILARINPIHPEGGWSCLYLIEAVHL